MLNILSKSLLGLGAAICTGGLGFLGAYEGTKKTFLDGLGEKRMVSGVGNGSQFVWTNLLVKLKDKNDNKTPKTEEFKSLEKAISSNEPENFSKLKEFCEKKSVEIYSTIIGSNEPLLEDFKNYCTITIRESFLDSTKLLKTSIENSENDSVVLKDKLKELEKHNDTNDGKLVDDLLKIKNSLSNSGENDSDWKELAKWCEKSFETTFLNENESLWKQTSKYCVKNP